MEELNERIRENVRQQNTVHSVMEWTTSSSLYRELAEEIQRLEEEERKMKKERDMLLEDREREEEYL